MRFAAIEERSQHSEAIPAGTLMYEMRLYRERLAFNEMFAVGMEVKLHEFVRNAAERELAGRRRVKLDRLAIIDDF